MARTTDSMQLPPPPPYEHEGGGPSTRPIGDYYIDHQTIPKRTVTSQDNMPTHNNNDQTNSSKFHKQVDKFNKHHTCIPNRNANSPGRKRSASGIEHGDRFVQSLAAPKAFLGHITIEPLAFIAMLALYIEFPAIQDLIYTKICLEVVAKHPNLTTINIESNHRPTRSLDSPATSSDKIVFFASNNTFNLNQQLPSNGRIQQQTTIPRTITPITPSAFKSDHGSRDHFLCDRLNKTAVPLEIRQEILDIDSLFWLKYQIIICSLCALSSPYWGGVSDKIGRLVPLNVSIAASTISNLISLIFGLLISLDSHSLFHVNWLYSGAILIGLSGGQSVLIMNVFSFISDNTTTEERTKRVTVLESVIYLSHSAGFFLNQLIMSLGLTSPERIWLNRHFVAFSACVLLNIICVLISLFKLRHHKFHRFLNNFEREQQEAAIIGDTVLSDYDGSFARHRGKHEQTSNSERLRELTSSTPDDLDGSSGQLAKSMTIWDALTSFKYYKQTYSAAMKPRDSRSIILLLLLSGFISALSLATLMSLLFIYLKMDPFNWTTSKYSMWNAITSISKGIALVALTLSMKFVAGWNVPDPLVAAIGFLSKGAGLVMIGVANSSAIINWSLLVFVLSEYSMPPIRSLLSKLVIKEELGKVYSCLGSLQNICFIFGNVAFYIAFTSFQRKDLFRLSFMVVAAIEFSALIIMLIIYTSLRRRVIVV